MTNDTRFIGRPHDFDFLCGDWQLTNRCLRARLSGCTEWDEFPATLRGQVLHDGAVSVDETRFTTRGFMGMTLRSLDRRTNRWAIYWINSGDGQLGPPVHGGFDGDRGEFYGDDTDAGRAVKVRFVWSRGVDTARWEQAFALPGAASEPAWEVNWIMEMKKGSR
jgi:hypothetical protein